MSRDSIPTLEAAGGCERADAGWNRCPIAVQGLETLGLARRMGREGGMDPPTLPTYCKSGATTTRQILGSLAATFGGLRHTTVPVVEHRFHHDATSHWAPNLASHSPVEACWTASPEIAATRPAHPLPDWACF